MGETTPWRAWLMASVAAVGIYFLLPGESLIQALIATGLSGAMIVALTVGLRQHRPANPLFWKLTIVGHVLNFIAYWLWYVYPVASGVELTFPGPSDPVYIAYYLIQVIALVVLVRSRNPGGNRADLIDASVVALGAAAALWEFQVERTIAASGLTLAGNVVALSYPFFDILLFALGVRLLVGGGRRPPALWFIAAFIFGQLTSDIAYSEYVLRGAFQYGSPNFAGWLLSFAFLGAAALHPSMQEVTEPAVEHRRTTLRRRLPFLAGAALVTPAVTLYSARYDLDANDDIVLLVAVTVVIFLLILARVSDLMVDVAEYERVQDEMSRLALIVESSDEAIIGWTTEGIITSWNQGASRLYGYEPNEALGQSFRMLLPEHRRPEAEMMLERVNRGDRVGNLESERRRKDGVVIPVSVTFSAIRDKHGYIVGGASIAQDITERKRTQAELAEARDAALEASRLKSEFLATMSHEIRTPMNGVIGLTGLLLRTQLDERQRQYAEGVQTAGEALLAVINDILDFSKIEAGRLEFEVVDFDVRDVVEEAVDLVSQTARSKGLELVGYCDPGLETAVRGDPGRLRQVLINLVSNAVKFTETGEVVLYAAAEGVDDDAVVVRFDVADTGIGIETEQLTRLFEPFSQADASTTRRYGGSGLGLAISRELVDRMGGELLVESVLGRGSTFSFTIALLRQTGAPAARPAPHGLAGLRALVVDNNETNRLILSDQLAAWAMEADAVGDAAAALERLARAAASGGSYDIVILDHCMEEIDGLELARRITADATHSNVRLILLSSATDVGTDEAVAAGLQARLTKPVRQSHLFDALMRATAPTIAAEASRRRRAPARMGARAHVLVVEDNHTNQMVALGLLDQLHYSADVAANGLEALEALDRAEYAAVLMDCQMPEMDGYQATAEIRRREGTEGHMPIIAMTAGAMEGDRERCLAAGMDDYIAKPVDATVLADALARWTGTDGAAGEAAIAAAAGNCDDGLDESRLAMLRQMGGGDGRLLSVLVDAFLTEAPRSVAALRAAVASGDPGAVVEMAHRLRGSAANLGAVRLASVCEHIETSAGAGDVASTRAEMALVEDALTTASAALQRALRDPR